MFPDEINGPIRRTAVHDQILDLRIILGKHRADRLLEVGGLVIGRSDD
jgi:hypothetical protein